MKFISCIILICAFLLSSCKKDDDLSGMYPPYKLMKIFSEKIKPETGLILTCYGINCGLPKGYQYKNGIGNFHVTYALEKSKNDVITIDEARNLLVFLVESFLQEINSNQEVIPDLDFHPFASNSLYIIIRFRDENKIQLGQGVARICFSDGKIKYEGYKISEYTNCYATTKGKSYDVREESYAEALDIIKKSGSLQLMPEKR